MTRFVLIACSLSALALAACGESADAPASGAAAAPDAAAGRQSAAPEASGPARAWAVNYENSTLNVHGEYGAKGFDGTFNEWAAQIIFSPADLAGSSIRAEVQVASLRSGDSSRDEAARSPRWLNAAAFPTAVFESSEIQSGAAGYVAVGTLTIAGVTSPLNLDFTVDIDGDTAHATGSTVFDHHALGITGGYDDPDTGDFFTVSFDINATAQ